LVKVDEMRRALCIKCVKLIVKYFFLEDVSFLGGYRRLRFLCIWINMVDNVQSRFCKKLMGIPRCAYSEFIEVELGGE
jgi:hypothetical protein